MNAPTAKDRIVLAADLPLPQAEATYRRVSEHVGCVKVGLSLFVEHGPTAVRSFKALGARVFLDLKLHDIPNTVQLASEQAAALGIDFLTVHAQGGRAMLEAAVKGVRLGAERSRLSTPKVLAVTLLTSMTEGDLKSMGDARRASDLVRQLAALAIASGVDGLVCSPLELKILRQALGPRALLCAPGIRSASEARGDQSRVESARFAIEAGADLLVIGRPIYAAADPRSSAQEILTEVSEAVVGRGPVRASP